MIEETQRETQSSAESERQKRQQTKKKHIHKRVDAIALHEEVRADTRTNERRDSQTHASKHAHIATQRTNAETKILRFQNFQPAVNRQPWLPPGRLVKLEIKRIRLFEPNFVLLKFIFFKHD